MTAQRPFSLGPQPHVLAIVLAGGEGTRLAPLTTERAKPAVPFGGTYRIIDFVLSNFVNSGIHRIKVLTQYKSDSLLNHLARGWHLSTMLDHYVEPVPAQQRLGKRWFQGSADALYQSLNVVTDENPDYVCVFGGDHIYRMDIRQMLYFHRERQAELTVAAVPVPIDEARAFGVIEVDAEGRMLGFEEKPENPKEMPGRPGFALASMGNYIFSADTLYRALEADAEDEGSAHDFGKNILPALYRRAPVYVYDFLTNVIPGSKPDETPYWRDVGTILSFYQANMDLIAVKPELNLYNNRWPVHSTLRPRAPAKFVFANEADKRVGSAVDSLISPGCIVSGGRVERSIVFPDVRVNSYARVEDSVLMDDIDVGRHCLIRRAIIDKHVQIPAETQIGVDLELDRQRGFTVTDEDIVVVPKRYKFSKR